MVSLRQTNTSQVYDRRLNITGPTPRSLRWLLVFDNVDHISALKPFWPAGSHGSVIITTLDPVIARNFGKHAIQVPLFTEKESEEFMLDINQDADATNEAELSALKTITDRLGYLPLVLHNIGAYTRSIASSYQMFLQHYLDFDRNLIFHTDGPDSTSYQASVGTTWTMTLSRIDPIAKALMENLVFFDSVGIPTALFEPCDINEM